MTFQNRARQARRGPAGWSVRQQRGGLETAEEIDHHDTYDENGERGARNTPARASFSDVHDAIQGLFFLKGAAQA
ncbi:hypothetical protein [Xanthobacter sp. ZOL 2024]